MLFTLKNLTAAQLTRIVVALTTLDTMSDDGEVSSETMSIIETMVVVP